MPELTADSILSLGRGFMESRILLSAVELDLFTLLAGDPMSAREVAAARNAGLRGTTILLDALAGLGFLVKQDGAYRCSEDVASLLSRDAPGSVAPMLMHSVALWRRWSELTEVVRRGTPAQAAAPEHRERERGAFIGAMHTIGRRMAEEVVVAIGPGPARRLLDIGGASGTYTQAFLEASHGLQATLFDLPPVVELARRRLGGTGLLERITFVAGDFYTDELPGGHDLALLSAIIHQSNAEQNVELYRKAHRALVPGGRLVIRDHVMSPDHTRPARGAVFAVNMLVGTEGGRTYSFEEIQEGLESAGYVRVRQLQADALMSGLVEAFTPE
jgi:SAM-dependent methyltransferase